MPRKKKTKIVSASEVQEAREKIEEEATTEKVDFGTSFSYLETTEVEVKTEEKPKSGLVKVKVLVGTLLWEGGKYEKGETFEVSKERGKSPKTQEH